MAKLWIPEEVDLALRWSDGEAERLAKAGKMRHITLPNGELRFLDMDIQQIMGATVQLKFDPATKAKIQEIQKLRKENPGITAAELEKALRLRLKKNQGG